MVKKLVISAMVTLTIATIYVLSRGTPTVGTPKASPEVVGARTPTLVTVIIRITDDKLMTPSVTLVRLDANGDVVSDVEMLDEDGANDDAVAGHRFFLRMRDDGTKGDAVAGDRVLTQRMKLNEAAAQRVYFEVHASFAGVERPVRSEPFAVDVRQQFARPLCVCSLDPDPIASWPSLKCWPPSLRTAMGSSWDEIVVECRTDRVPI
jgi:hypothetical protein